MLPKGSSEWAYRTLNRLKWALEQKRITEGEYNGILEELDRFQVWNIIPPEKPYGSREAMLKAEVGYSESEGRARTLNPNPGPEPGTMTKATRNSAPINGDSNNKCTGSTNEYFLARLDRDRPDLLERVKAGEMSPNAAAVKAGFRKPPITIPADPIKASRRLLKHFSGATLTTLLTELANHAGFDLTPRR